MPKAIINRALDAKNKQWGYRKPRLVFERSYPDYSKTTIEEKFIKQGAD